MRTIRTAIEFLSLHDYPCHVEIAMVKTRIRDKRFCYCCGSNETGKWKNRSNWYLNHDSENNVLCSRCYARLIKNPRIMPKWRARRYTYCGQRLFEDKKSRTGICSKCGIKVGDRYIGWRNKIVTVQQTQMHHEFYLVICPWFGRIELCVACHSYIRWR